MIPLAPTRAVRPARDPVLVLGLLLVLVLVTVLPLTLALVHAGGSCDDAGVGSGVGDTTAAALSSLQRDLNAKRAHGDALPDHTERIVPAFLAAVPPHPEAAHAPGLSSSSPSRYDARIEPAPVGPGPDGTPLLF